MSHGNVISCQILQTMFISCVKILTKIFSQKVSFLASRGSQLQLNVVYDKEKEYKLSFVDFKM